MTTDMVLRLKEDLLGNGLLYRFSRTDSKTEVEPILVSEAKQYTHACKLSLGIFSGIKDPRS